MGSPDRRSSFGPTVALFAQSLQRSRLPILIRNVQPGRSVQAMKPTDLERLARVRAIARSGEARDIRITARISQAEVAQTCGVAQPTIGSWESGRRVPRGLPALRYLTVLELLRDVRGPLGARRGHNAARVDA